jgi:multidrug efflux pump subunit AcrB
LFGQQTDPFCCLRADLAGGAEIGAADASGTLTTVAAFFPLVLVGGLVGTFLKPFGLVVSSALLVSLVVSLTFVPAAFSRRAASRTSAWLSRPCAAAI